MSHWTETFRGAVQVSEYDSEAHMNTRMYVTRFDQATWFLLGTIGITPSAMKQDNRRMAIVRQRFQYDQELVGGELIYVESGFIAVGKKYLRFMHRMYNMETKKMIATADYTAFQADKQSGKTVAVQPHHREAAEVLLVAEKQEIE